MLKSSEITIRVLALISDGHMVVCVQDPLEFPAHELRKYFRMGDHVKVIAGRYEGDTGLIVRVEENFVILFSDLTMHEVFAPPTWSTFIRRNFSLNIILLPTSS